MVQGKPAMHRATLRPYTVFGKRYYPGIVPLGTQESGIASWYGPDFHGKKTSNGEVYDMYAPGTAAHKTLPMNTIVRVTHVQTGDQVTVRINDRGPFVEGRIIDLSYTAGKALGLDVSGIAPVKLEVLEYDDYIMAQNPGGRTPVRVATPAKAPPKPVAAEVTPVAPSPVQRSTHTPKGYAIQIGAFRSEDGASVLAEQTRARFGGQTVRVRAGESGGKPIHRVLMEGFESREDADRFMQEQGIAHGVVISPS
jgi:rare lipoprotein A